MGTELVVHKLDPKDMIYKSNRFVEASYKLTLNEQRLILLLASKVNPLDEEFHSYRFRMSELYKMLGIKSNDYTELNQIAKGLMKKVFDVKMDNHILTIAWFVAVRYYTGSGIIEIEFHPELKPFFLQLKEFYTKYRLENVIQLKSVYAIRLYELLKQYENIRERTFTLEQLRNFVGLEPKQYALYADFKRNVLKAAQKEINKKTDIIMDWDEKKEKRKVVSLTFSIQSRNTKAKAPVLEEEKKDELLDDSYPIEQRLASFGLTALQIKRMLEKHDEKYLHANLNYTMIMYQQGRVKTVAAYAIRAIRQDFSQKMSPFSKVAKTGKKKAQTKPLENKQEENQLKLGF